MTQVTRFAWPLPVMSDHLGFSHGSNVAEIVTPVDFAHASNGAAVQVAVAITEYGEILTGETVTGTDLSSAAANANDRDYTTFSHRASGVEGGTVSWSWNVDFGSAVEVTSMDIDDPVGSEEWRDEFTNVVEFSDNGSSWTSSSYTYSSTTVPTGLVFPDPTTTTRHTYTLDTPSTHRYWRMRQSVGAGFHFESGMSEWYIYGSASTSVAWGPAPAANDGNTTTYATSDATFPGREWLQVDLGSPRAIYRAELRVGVNAAGSKTFELYGSTDAAFTSPVLLDSVTFSATGSYTADEVVFSWVPAASYQYYRIESADEDRRVYDLNMYSAAVGGALIEHGALTGRDDAEQHPADAVTLTDTAGWFEGTEVEAALAELAAKAIGYQAHGNTGATETFDAATGWHSATLNAACTFTLTANPSGTVSSLFLELAQDGTGGWAITLPSSVTNKAALEADQDTTLNTTSLLVLLSRDGGTTWYGGWWGQSSGSSLTVEDEGTPLATDATTLDFVGAGVTASGTGATKTITIPGGAGDLDDLTDVTITSPTEDDDLRYNGSAWVNDARKWEVVTDGEDVLVWESDDLVYEWSA